MKIKLRPDEPGAQQASEWSEMNDWLAGLREDGETSTTDETDVAFAAAEPAEPSEPAAVVGEATGFSAADVAQEPRPVVAAEPGAPARPVVAAEPDAPARSRPGAPAGPRPRVAAGRPAVAGPRPRREEPAGTPVRALIGEQLRTPTVWCELGPCISWHADRDALGVADVRARAIADGWRIDALGRLTCPQCQQRSASFRATQPVVLWNRAYALTMAARQAARQGGHPYPRPAFYPR